MSRSNNAAADGDFSSEEEKIQNAEPSTLSFEERVNGAASQMTQGEDGNWILPEGLSEDVAYAATLEKRRRDTQSAYAKTSQTLEATKAKATSLEQKLHELFTPKLSPEEVEELDDLKSSDPDAWRLRMQELEDSALDAFEEELSDLDFDEESVGELATRASQLTEFLDDNPGLVLDDEVFENDLPPRITGKLERGEITFGDFLVEAKNFLSKSQVIADTEEDEDDEPHLNKAGGGSTASEHAISGDVEKSYINEIY